MNEHHFQNLSAALSLGFLAEEVVFATGRILRGQALGDEDRAALVHAKDLLEAVAKPRKGLVLGQGRRHLSERGAVNALEAELHPSPSENPQDYATRLAEVLGHALNGGVEERERKQLEAVRQQFASLARASLAEVSSLSQRRRDKGPWPRRTTSTSASYIR